MGSAERSRTNEGIRAREWVNHSQLGCCVGGPSGRPRIGGETAGNLVDGVLGLQLHGGKDILEPCSVVLSEEVQVVG